MQFYIFPRSVSGEKSALDFHFHKYKLCFEQFWLILFNLISGYLATTCKQLFNHNESLFIFQTVKPGGSCSFVWKITFQSSFPSNISARCQIFISSLLKELDETLSSVTYNFDSEHIEVCLVETVLLLYNYLTPLFMLLLNIC